jgi:hypothetical protein
MLRGSLLWPWDRWQSFRPSRSGLLVIIHRDHEAGQPVRVCAEQPRDQPQAQRLTFPRPLHFRPSLAFLAAIAPTRPIAE